MPTPQVPVTIGVKSSTLAAGDYIIFRNLTNGGKKIVKVTAKKEALIIGVPDDWVRDDVIMIELQGRANLGSSNTITKGGIKKDIGTVTAETGLGAVNL